MNVRDIASASQAEEVAAAQRGLAQMIARLTEGLNSLIAAIPGLTLHRWATPTEPASYILEQSICMIAQGSKRVLLGEEEYTYDANSFLLTSLGLPLVASIIEASEEKPYLGLTLELDQRAVAKLMVDSNLPQPRTQQTHRGMAIGEVSLPMLKTFQRLIDLLDRPEDIPILAPLVKKEILYYLLIGDQGPRLRQIAMAGSRSHQLVSAIDWLRDNFTQKLRVDDLAAETGMSTSTFHHHFRALTAMSPLQFQKNLRLNEARSLMLTGNMDAATAAFEVGYESPSQFSREYSRRFGAPPLRDIKSLRQTAVGKSG